MSMFGPSLRATLYTAEIPADYFAVTHRARGYYRNCEPWAVVTLGDVQLTAVGGEGLAGMQRLVYALTSALAQARQAEQDEALTEGREPESVSA